jgi:hypothetical protein
MTTGDAQPSLSPAEAAERARFTEPDGEVHRANREREARHAQLIAFRVSPTLRAALEGAAAEAERSLSQEIRYRLERSLYAPRMLEETMRVVLSAVKAGVSAEQIARLIEIHMESFKR